MQNSSEKEKAMAYKVTHEFEVEIERDDDEENEGQRYTACCMGLTGCRVHASTEAEALDKIRTAIDIWLDFADRQMDDEFDVEDYL